VTGAVRAATQREVRAPLEETIQIASTKAPMPSPLRALRGGMPNGATGAQNRQRR